MSESLYQAIPYCLYSAIPYACQLTFRIVVNKVKLLCVLASQDGLSRVQAEYPGVEVNVQVLLWFELSTEEK